jgi:hypothetical protein
MAEPDWTKLFAPIDAAGSSAAATSPGVTARGGGWQDIPGWFDYGPLYDQAVATVPEGGVIVEVGAWLGRSTAYLAGLVKRANRGIRFYTVDHCLGSNEEAHAMVTNASGGNLAGALVNNLRHCGVYDAVTPILTTSLRAAELFAPESLAFVFIDASHDYENVRKDIAAWWPKVARGGLMAGHDYQPGWPEVVRAVDDAFGSKFGAPGRRLATIACPNAWSVFKTGENAAKVV